MVTLCENISLLERRHFIFICELCYANLWEAFVKGIPSEIEWRICSETEELSGPANPTGESLEAVFIPGAFVALRLPRRKLG